MYLLYMQGIETTVGDIVAKDALFQHLKVARKRVDDEVYLFDGLGLVLRVKITALSKRSATLQVQDKKRYSTAGQNIRLIIGVPKLVTLELILQKATEVGVKEIVLVKSEYTPVVFDQDVFTKKQDRWQKIIISACEQSQRVIAPKIVFENLNDLPIAGERLVCHIGKYENIQAYNLKENIEIAIGPEGGWSNQDLDLLKGKLVSLTDGILRTDTACIAALLASKL